MNPGIIVLIVFIVLAIVASLAGTIYFMLRMKRYFNYCKLVANVMKEFQCLGRKWMMTMCPMNQKVQQFLMMNCWKRKMPMNWMTIVCSFLAFAETKC